MHDLMPVPFRNATLFLADVDGIPYAPMKPIVEGMGMSWAAQTVKLNSNKARWGVSIIETPADPQPMLCIPLRKLPGWLMTISQNKVKPEIRETVIAYQNECDDALWDYWSKGHAERKPTTPQSFADALQLAADQQRIIEQQHAQLEASLPKIAFHDQVTHGSETLIDWAQAFSLLQRRTGQSFTSRTFLDFLRRHGIACQPNLYANIGRDRFKPRKDYINTWFVSELSPKGGVEWMLRPYAISEIVRLIEKERNGAAMVAGYLEHQEDAA
jgi:phage antirepressor YoqD-like protein